MRFICIESYMIPTFGNRRTEPYGRMVVEHNGETRTVRFGERDGLGRRYITFNRKRYYFHNKGNLYSPIFVFEDEDQLAFPPVVENTAKEAHLSGLLNTLVDSMVDEVHENLPVIRKLAKLGFSEDDMTLTLGFPPEEVRSVLEEENGIADAC